MKINKGYIAIGLIIAFTVLVELAAHADEFDDATKIIFTQPVHIPGQVLPKGTDCLKWPIMGTKPMSSRYPAHTECPYGTFLTNSTELQEDGQ